MFSQEARTAVREKGLNGAQTPSPAFPITDDWLLDEAAALSAFVFLSIHSLPFGFLLMHTITHSHSDIQLLQ